MTEAFTLDTSGDIFIPDLRFPDASTRIRWSDLDPFTHGFIEAALKVIQWPDPAEGHGPSSSVVRYDWLAPETLARIIADCAASALRIRYVEPSQAVRQRELGSMFWRDRQKGLYARTSPPLAPYLGDDGKVYLREVGQ